MTNGDLSELYKKFNKKYFGNRLPKDMVVCYVDLYAFGQAVTRYYGGRPLYVEMHKRLRWSRSQSALTLLHEMVHISIPYRFNHGPEFHKRMLALAKLGAFKPYW